VLVGWALFVVAGAGAFATLVCGAVLAVLAGGVPALRAFARAGGAAAVATVGLVAWAPTLTARQRAGHSLGYAAGLLGWSALVAACLAAWTVAAAAIARSAPWLLAGRPVGHPGPTLAPQLGLPLAGSAAAHV